MHAPNDSFLETDGACWRILGLPKSEQLAELAPILEKLVFEAREAKIRAHAPYSHFRVGSALLMDGKLFSGANVENASYGATLCAERTAIVSAVAAGLRKLEIIAVSTDAEPGSPLEQRSPCGLCRQVISEFAGADTLVLLDAGDRADGRIIGELIAFEALLPWRFRLEH